MGAAGILFQTTASLEETGRIQIVALDKTGTILRQPDRDGHLSGPGVTEGELLRLACALERRASTRWQAVLRRAGGQADRRRGRGLPGPAGQRTQGHARRAAALRRQRGPPHRGRDLTRPYRREAESALGGRQDAAVFARGGKLLASSPWPTCSSPAAQAIRCTATARYPRRHDHGRQCAHGESHRRAGRRDEVIAGVLPDGRAARSAA